MPLTRRHGEGAPQARRWGHERRSRSGTVSCVPCTTRPQAQGSRHLRIVHLLGVTLSSRLLTSIVRHRSDCSFEQRRLLASLLPARLHKGLPMSRHIDPAVIVALKQRRRDSIFDGGSMIQTAKNALLPRLRFVLVAGLVATLLTPTVGYCQDAPMKASVAALQATVESLSRKSQLERGRKIYFEACSPCHGIRGDGAGPAAQGFNPAPRNFRRGVYKFRSTVSGSLPLDEDLERTVSEGLPGTEMPRWKEVLSAHDIQAVVQYVKTFSPFFDDPKSRPKPKDIVQVPEDRPFERSARSIAAGQKIYIEQDCVKCHGKVGAADGTEANKLEDDWHDPIKPANLTLRHLKSGKTDRDIFRIFTTGLNGTPMPAFDELSIEQRWQLIDFIQSLEQKGMTYWLFKENPNQVRHPQAAAEAAKPPQ